jgi:methionine-rich copper-binding protein CopC
MENMKRMSCLVLTVFTVMISIAVGLGVVGINKPAPASAQAPKTFELGILEGLSGQFSEMTILNNNGEMLAVGMMNERGGLTIKGEKYIIKPVVEDTKNTAEGAVAAANRLVYDKKLKVRWNPLKLLYDIAMAG